MTALQGFLNKGLTKLIFGSDASLNLDARDLGEGAVKMNYESEAVTRLSTCIGEVMSLNAFRKCTITVSVSKTSESYWRYCDLIEKDKGIISGNLQFINDVGREFTIYDLSVEKGEDNGDGENASVEFTIRGTQLCNQSAFEF